MNCTCFFLLFKCSHQKTVHGAACYSFRTVLARPSRPLGALKPEWEAPSQGLLPPALGAEWDPTREGTAGPMARALHGFLPPPPQLPASVIILVYENEGAEAPKGSARVWGRRQRSSLSTTDPPTSAHQCLTCFQAEVSTSPSPIEFTHFRCKFNDFQLICTVEQTITTIQFQGISITPWAVLPHSYPTPRQPLIPLSQHHLLK